MIQRGEQARFALESAAAGWIVTEAGADHFDGDVAPKRQIAGSKNLSHPAGAQQRDDLKRTELTADESRRHDGPILVPAQPYATLIRYNSVHRSAPGEASIETRCDHPDCCCPRK